MNTVESIRQVLISGIMTTVIHSEHLHRKDLPEVVAAAVHLQKQMMNRIVHREIHRVHRVAGVLVMAERHLELQMHLQMFLVMEILKKLQIIGIT